jgi:hypothetical protein
MSAINIRSGAAARAALALAITLAGAAQAARTHNGNLPDWAAKAFEKVE